MKKQIIYYLLAIWLVFAAVFAIAALPPDLRNNPEKKSTEVSANSFIGKKKPKKVKTTKKQKRKHMYRPGARQN